VFFIASCRIFSPFQRLLQWAKCSVLASHGPSRYAALFLRPLQTFCKLDWAQVWGDDISKADFGITFSGCRVCGSAKKFYSGVFVSLAGSNKAGLQQEYEIVLYFWSCAIFFTFLLCSLVLHSFIDHRLDLCNKVWNRVADLCHLAHLELNEQEASGVQVRSAGKCFTCWTSWLCMFLYWLIREPNERYTNLLRPCSLLFLVANLLRTFCKAV